MTEAIIILAAAAAAAYLLRPLFAGRGRRLLLIAPLLLAAYAAPARAEGGGADASIGFLLIAVDAQRDHLRVSEAIRLVNPGPPHVLELTITLPPGAMYLTIHRGLQQPAAVPEGFRERVVLPRGISEVVFSYALPAGRERAVARAYPLPVQRLEIVARGRGVGLVASRGETAGALTVGGERLPRWEIRGLGAGEPFTFTIRGLPVSRPWLPPAAAGIFAVLLAGGLGAAARARALPLRR